MSARKRSDNFSLDQRMMLIELIQNQKSVIEGKKCDTQSNLKKHAAWEAIARDMQAAFPDRAKSSANELKELWRRLKTKAKAKAREKKVDILETGGGKSVVGDIDDEILQILNIIVDDLQQLHNKYDDDSATIDQQANVVSVVPDDIDVPRPSVSTMPSTSATDVTNISGTITVEAENGAAETSSVNDAAEMPTANDASDDSIFTLPQNNTSSGITRTTSSPVLKKADEALHYLKDEHTCKAKMKLISLQQEAARSKTAYYNEKRKRLCLDL